MDLMDWEPSQQLVSPHHINRIYSGGILCNKHFPLFPDFRA